MVAVVAVVAVVAMKGADASRRLSMTFRL